MAEHSFKIYKTDQQSPVPVAETFFDRVEIRSESTTKRHKQLKYYKTQSKIEGASLLLHSIIQNAHTAAAAMAAPSSQTQRGSRFHRGGFSEVLAA